jgi:hypothetical protein
MIIIGNWCLQVEIHFSISEFNSHFWIGQPTFFDKLTLFSGNFLFWNLILNYQIISFLSEIQKNVQFFAKCFIIKFPDILNFTMSCFQFLPEFSNSTLYNRMKFLIPEIIYISDLIYNFLRCLSKGARYSALVTRLSLDELKMSATKRNLDKKMNQFLI